MSRRVRLSDADDYESANSAWAGLALPPVTKQEAQRAARKLIRHFGGKTTGRWVRRCWVAISPPFDNLNRGWRRLVHDVSHRVFRQTHPNTRPHGGAHAAMEREMAEYVIAHGWLTRSLLTVTVKSSPTTEQKLDAAKDALGRWESKKRRADTAIRKYRRRVRYYQGRTVQK